MKWRMGFPVVVAAVLLGYACVAQAGCGPDRVDVGGYKLWMQTAGKGKLTVVFVSGVSDDSSVWKDIEPVIREHHKVRTVVYDRAGLGKSDPKPGDYHLMDEVAAVKTALAKCGVSGPMVLVAHSYGGFISWRMAAADFAVKGLVFVDANLGSFFDDAEVARLQARYTPQFEALRQEKPELARLMIPLMEAYPETVKRVRVVDIPPKLPVIDIVAEKTWVDTPDELTAMRKAHADFVAASPAREAVFAKGSGHYVMRDRPDLVIAAIDRMVEKVKGQK
ncbi:MAG TPA: alpha/beta hydrolase [Acidobacteriaceae bacterium]